MPNATLGGHPVDAACTIRRDSTGMTVGHGRFEGPVDVEDTMGAGESICEGPVEHFGRSTTMRGSVIFNTLNTHYGKSPSVSGAFVLAGKPEWIK